MTTFQTIVLAIVEGITEFLPISSTGHMIIASSLMGIAEDSFTKNFSVIIQFGAILSVVVLYWKRFFKSINFYLKLIVGFIPAAILGLTFDSFIDSLLGNVLVVASTLLLGGIFLLFVDKIFKIDPKDTEVQEVTYKISFWIGCFQTIAMIPGVSRSAATIIGGLYQKLNRKTAAEFSFFLAVPTMFAATSYKLLKMYKEIEPNQIQNLLIGNIIAFIVAMIAIKAFISYLTKHGFKIFGYYRIVLGLLILILHFAGFNLHIF